MEFLTLRKKIFYLIYGVISDMFCQKAVTMPSDSIAEEEDEIKVGGFSLQNLSCCYNENFEIPFDVVLEVSDGHKVEELKAHQFVLALHSDVLEEKIRSSAKSKSTTPIRLQFQCEDIEVLKVLIKFCYNIIDPMFDKTLRFLIAIYREAEKFNIVELQVWPLSRYVL